MMLQTFLGTNPSRSICHLQDACQVYTFTVPKGLAEFVISPHRVQNSNYFNVVCQMAFKVVGTKSIRRKI